MGGKSLNEQDASAASSALTSDQLCSKHVYSEQSTSLLRKSIQASGTLASMLARFTVQLQSKI